MFSLRRLLPFLLLLLLQSVSVSCIDPVIIIGAGVAGSKVAYDLFRARIPFLILEATARVGGRLRRAKLGTNGPSIELGANWLQGFRKDDPFSKLVTEVINITGVFDYTDDYYFVRNGKIVPDAKANPVWNRLERAVEGAYRIQAQFTLPDGSLSQDLSVRSAMLLSTGWTGDEGLEIPAEQSEIDFEYAASADEVSIADLSSFYNPDGLKYTNNFINDPRGFRRLVDWHLHRAGISNTRRSGANLMLSSPVKEILYDSNRPQVILRDGRKINGSAIVSTVSLGVLQQSLRNNIKASTRLVFRPDLPPAKKVAISKMRIGDYLKIFIQFHNPVFTNSDPLYLAPVDCFSGRWISVQNLNAKGHHPEQNVVLLTAVASFASGLWCESKDALLQSALAYISAARGRDVLRTEIRELTYYRWGNRQYFQGSYSFRPVGFTLANDRDLNSKVGALFFAGEAHASNLRGYVQGAYFTAEKTAREVIDFTSSAAPAKVGNVLT